MDLEGSGKTARRRLLSTAVESVQYVALGTVMKRDLAKEFGVPEDLVEKQLHAICLDLCEDIRRL